MKNRISFNIFYELKATVRKYAVISYNTQLRIA